MLYLNIKRIAALRNIPNLFTYLTQHGFSPNIAHRILKHTDSHIKLQYLERLCLLFHCTPNDLLQWQPGNGNHTDKEPLGALVHDNTSDILNYLQRAPIEELVRLREQYAIKAGSDS